MAKYTHLDIYKATFDFLQYAGSAITHFSREFRYTVGEKLIEETIEFISLIYRANSAQDSSSRAEVIKLIHN